VSCGSYAWPPAAGRTVSWPGGPPSPRRRCRRPRAAAIDADPALRQALTGPGFLAATTRLGAEGRVAPGRTPRRVVLGAYLEHRLRTAPAPGARPYDAAEILDGLGWLPRSMPGRGAFVSAAALAASTRWLRRRRAGQPRDLRAFLYHAHVLGLLDESDGGYRFIHPLLREHVSAAPDGPTHRLVGRRPARGSLRLCRTETPVSRAPAA
jgi:hypothetical protein